MGYEGLPFLIASSDADTVGSVARRISHVARRPTEIGRTREQAHSLWTSRPVWTGVVAEVALAPDGAPAGLEFASEVLHAAPATPIVVVAKHPRARWVNRAAALGISMVCKPASIDALKPFIRRALDAELLQQGTDTRLLVSLEAEVLRAELGTLRAAELLRLAVAGHSRAQVEAAMKIGSNCYAYHVGQLLRSTGAPDLQALVIRILRNALEVAPRAAPAHSTAIAIPRAPTKVPIHDQSGVRDRRTGQLIEGRRSGT